jgi:non-heme chloroperoxidase
MSFVRTADGTNIFYKDWGKGQPVIFSHGWPLSADAWDAQMLFLALRGYRVIAHDRRGHGRSDQPWQGNDMDTYADDLAALLEALDLRDAVMVGHSTGGGEVARYVGRHGTSRISKVVLVGAVPPLMLRTEANPSGSPMETFDAILHGEDDQIVPIAASALKAVDLVPHAKLKVYPRGSHGLAQIQVAEFNQDLLAFVEEGS